MAVARTVIGIRKLKVFSFGPRPQDFYACNAPIAPLYRLGIEVMENSELDLFELFRSAAIRVLYDAAGLLSVVPVHTPRQPGDLYPSENPFAG